MLVVVAFAVFVGISIRRAPSPRAADAAQPTPDIAANTIVRNAAPPPVQPSTDSIVAKIAATPGTYLGDMIVEQGNRVIRWPETTQQPLRVWVQTASALRDWSDAYAQMARDALAEWQTSGIPLRTDFIFDSATANIRVQWREQFPPADGSRVGVTALTYDQYGWIAAATITAALHDSLGRVIPPHDLLGVLRHESGHALGLGHSRDPKTKMYPVESVVDIQPADRATLALLYTLPPGRVR